MRWHFVGFQFSKCRRARNEGGSREGGRLRQLRAKCTGFPQVGERAGGQGWKGGGLGTHKEKAAREGKGEEGGNKLRLVIRRGAESEMNRVGGGGGSHHAS